MHMSMTIRMCTHMFDAPRPIKLRLVAAMSIHMSIQIVDRYQHGVGRSCSVVAVNGETSWARRWRRQFEKLKPASAKARCRQRNPAATVLDDAATHTRPHLPDLGYMHDVADYQPHLFNHNNLQK